MTMNDTSIIDLRKQQQHRIELQEVRRDEIIGTVGVWGPITIPLIPAALTAIAISTHYPDLLNIPQWVAIGLGIIAAGGIETLGIVSTETFLQMRSYEQMRSDEDEPAPVVASGLVAAAYLMVVIALVVLLKIWSALAIWSLLPLTCLGALVSWIVVLRRQHGRRELAQMAAKTEQSEVERLTTLNTQLTSQLTSAEQRTEQLTDQIKQLTGQLSDQSTDQSELDRLNSLAAKLNTELFSRDQSIEQLNNEIDQLKSEQSRGKPAKSEQLVVYQNGDIVHGTEHLELTEQIRAIAQRMVDSGQSVNKAKIARLVSCSRTTVQSALAD